MNVHDKGVAGDVNSGFWGSGCLPTGVDTHQDEAYTFRRFVEGCFRRIRFTAGVVQVTRTQDRSRSAEDSFCSYIRIEGLDGKRRKVPGDFGRLFAV